MKTILALLILNVSLLAVEPIIPGRVIANVELAFNGGLDVSWEHIPPKRPTPGSVLSIEWGDGQYFTMVIAVHGNTILVDYFPTSVVVDHGALVRLFSGSIKKSGAAPNKQRSRKSLRH